MASTNKTENYNLSQFIGTDKPAWLTDYNQDMNKIDTQMKVNADNVATAISSASTATSTANTANSTASSALSTAQTANSTANSANTTAGNAQSTANSALSTATTAQTTANNAIPKSTLTFTDFDDLTLTITNGTKYDESVKCATNADGTVGKLYGRFRVQNKSGTITATASTKLRPTSQITIQCLGNSFIGANNSFNNLTEGRPVDVTISTNGDISISSGYNAGTNESFYLYPCLLFMEDFGDTPTPEE